MDGWIIDEQTYRRGRRYELPDWPELMADEQAVATEGDQMCFLLLRPLTDAEALERESLGIVEWYYLDGREPAVRRTYDLAAMTAYDYRHCLLDFRLPARQEGRVRLMAMHPDDPQANLRLLEQMPPRLAQWVADCIADVNMRSPQGRRRLQEAKKN